MVEQNLHFFAKTLNFDQIYLNTVSKNQNVEELSLDLIFQSKVFVNKTPS